MSRVFALPNNVSNPGSHTDLRMEPSKHAESSNAAISAFYSLEFPSFTYYIQNLNVTIGRRCIAASPQSVVEVDVDLGPLKSVSRLHAKIDWEEDIEKFVLAVVGRNGAWVDGVWSGSGSKVPLTERSQIQIASRTFHFVLPPPAAPSASPSPPSPSPVPSPRARSPSLDIITTASPPSSLPSPPRQDAVASKAATTSGKKRKKAGAKGKGKAEPPPPEPEPAPPALTRPAIKPTKPPFTYAVMVYRAINALNGKATLQDIVTWMRSEYDFYKYSENNTWESSVRHTLSGNRAFQKAEKNVGDKPKTHYWTIDAGHSGVVMDQDARARQAALNPIPPAPELKVEESGDAAASAHAELEATKTQTPAAFGIPPGVCVPIVVGPPYPAGTGSTSASDSGPPPFTPQTPILLHANTLHLDPRIFSSITQEQLSGLQALGAGKALEILQSYIKNYLVEKMREGKGTSRGKKPKSGKPRVPKPPKEDKLPGGSLFTRAPLPPREGKPTPPVPTPPVSNMAQPYPYPPQMHSASPGQHPHPQVYYAHPYAYGYSPHMIMAPQMHPHQAPLQPPPPGGTLMPLGPGPNPTTHPFQGSTSTTTPVDTSAQPNTSVATAEDTPRAESPILIVDDDSDEREAPAKKRRKAE